MSFFEINSYNGMDPFMGECSLSNCKQYELEKHSLTLSYCPLTDSVITSQFQSLFCASLVKKKN